MGGPSLEKLGLPFKSFQSRVDAWLQLPGHVPVAHEHIHPLPHRCLHVQIGMPPTLLLLLESGTPGSS